jgi:hypothetical protein
MSMALTTKGISGRSIGLIKRLRSSTLQIRFCLFQLPLLEPEVLGPVDYSCRRKSTREVVGNRPNIHLVACHCSSDKELIFS